MDIIFLFHIPRVPLRLPWALGYALLWAFSPLRVPLALGWQRNAFLRRIANGRVYYYEDSRLICIFLSKSANI